MDGNKFSCRNSNFECIIVNRIFLIFRYVNFIINVVMLIYK